MLPNPDAKSIHDWEGERREKLIAFLIVDGMVS